MNIKNIINNNFNFKVNLKIIYKYIIIKSNK